jgi:hypothetical protein
MRLTLLVFLFATCNVCAFAQAVPAQVSTSELRALLERIDKLEKRVAELEAKDSSTPASREGTQVQAQDQTQPSAAPASVATSRPPGQSGHAAEAQQQVAAESESFPSLHIRGFADVDFVSNDQPSSRNNSGFTLGQFVLHFASRLSNKISYFGEVSLTAQPNIYNVDLERSFIRYDVNDAAKISFGKYHTPINYWNTAFHHGAWLQTTIARPNMIRFGGTFLPVHFVGAQSEGTIPSGGLNIGYNVGIGNGRELAPITLSRAGDNGDINNNRSWLINVYSRPSRFSKLQVGASLYNDKITELAAIAPGPQGLNFREWIATGHLIWAGESPEFLAEFANVHHRSILTGDTFDSQGAYAQVAYRLPFWSRRWKPYFRYDYIDVSRSEPVFANNVEDVRGSTAGVRYDISEFAAFKAEYRNGLAAPGTKGRVNGLAVQTAFTF